MALGQGFEGILGIIKEASYGSVLEVTEAIPFVSESFGNEIEKHADEVLRGKAGAGASIAGNKSYPFTIPCKLTYEDLDLLIAIAMGAAGSPVANGDLYDNTYSLAEDLDYSFVAAAYKGVSVWEYLGCKIDTMKISGEANKPLDFEITGAAKSLSLDSATNTSVVLTALDTADAASKIMFSDLEFKIAAQASALSGETEKGIGSFELALANALALDQFDNRAVTILEPERNGFREVKFSFKVPRYEADTYLDWRDGDTALHAYLKFASGNYLFDIHIPLIKIDKCTAPISGPGLIEQNIECTCFRDPASVSASYTLTDEFEIDVTNARSASPLA
ncbi:MAG: phage tail tube protein [Planctomycetota bacterium]